MRWQNGFEGEGQPASTSSIEGLPATPRRKPSERSVDASRMRSIAACSRTIWPRQRPAPRWRL